MTGGGSADGLPPELRKLTRRLDRAKTFDRAATEPMLALLAADDTGARYTALYRYCADWRHTRLGGPSAPFTERVEHATHRCAVQELASLAGRPGPARDTSPNYVYALYALWFCVRPKDAVLVEEALTNAVGGDPELLAMGIPVAGRLLTGTRRSTVHRMRRLLGRLATDPAVAPVNRADALRALGNGSRRRSVTLLLLAALDDPELVVSANAAWALLDRGPRHVNRVRRVAASWPERPELPPYAWTEVRDRLAHGGR